MARPLSSPEGSLEACSSCIDTRWIAWRQKRFLVRNERRRRSCRQTGRRSDSSPTASSGGCRLGAARWRPSSTFPPKERFGGLSGCQMTPSCLVPTKGCGGRPRPAGNGSCSRPSTGSRARRGMSTRRFSPTARRSCLGSIRSMWLPPELRRCRYRPVNGRRSLREATERSICRPATWSMWVLRRPGAPRPWSGLCRLILTASRYAVSPCWRWPA